MKTKKALTHEDVKKIAAAAEAEAKKNNWAVSISIVDDGAHMMHFQRLDNANLASVQISMEKAKTAILGKRETRLYEEAVAAGRNAALSMPGITHLEGGVPIFVDGDLVGAVGVSGVQSAQDAQVAKAGIAAVV